MRKFFLLAVALLSGLLAYSQQFEPEWAGEVTILKIDEDTTAIPTEKSIPKVKTSSSAGRLLVGIGNVRQKAIIKNGRSTTQINPENTVTLVVKCKDTETDPTTFIQVVKFEEKKKERNLHNCRLLSPIICHYNQPPVLAHFGTLPLPSTVVCF